MNNIHIKNKVTRIQKKYNGNMNNNNNTNDINNNNNTMN